MKRKVKALLLNSTAGKVESITFDGEYDSIHAILGRNVEAIQWEEFDNGDILYFDYEQETNYRKKDPGFKLGDGLCFYGNGLLVGNKGKNNDGNHWSGTNVNFSKEVIEDVVVFGRLTEVLQVVQ